MTDTPESNVIYDKLDKELAFMCERDDLEAALVDMLNLARKLERERDELKKALRLSGKRCDEVHHPKEMQHGYGTDCPVEAFIQKLLQ